LELPLLYPDLVGTDFQHLAGDLLAVFGGDAYGCTHDGRWSRRWFMGHRSGLGWSACSLAPVADGRRCKTKKEECNCTYLFHSSVGKPSGSRWFHSHVARHGPGRWQRTFPDPRPG